MIRVEETNIALQTDLVEHELVDFIIKERVKLKSYIRNNPHFLTSMEPVLVRKGPSIVRKMSLASFIANVGPMAAVAGTISQLCLEYLLNLGAKYVIVDNGGDVAMKTNRDVVVGLYSGYSSLSGSIGFKIKHRTTPLGICTSSGTVGHSISFGRADSVTVFARKASISDALATSIANQAQSTSDSDSVQRCLSFAEDLREHFRGVLVVVGESAGTIGKIPKMVETNKKLVLGDFFDLF